MSATDDIARLLDLMRRLRDPKGGCPWDREQDFSSIAPYTIEEAYEVSAAIEAGDYAGLKDELGDLLLQVIFHAQMASEKGFFGFADVAHALKEKMIRRHPHVFGDAKAASAGDVSEAWDEIKRRERAEKHGKGGHLDAVAHALPALSRSVKLQERAAEVGFDWPSASNVTEKIAAESRELADAAAKGSKEKLAEEFGDLLFALANLARHLRLDPEGCLRAANAKFVRRFKAIEDGLHARGHTLEGATLAEMETLWEQAKEAERR
ncbi:MAG: nucleoside triphosphate pyrophosphohydrolase [Alphaproteobacteria bacterium]